MCSYFILFFTKATECLGDREKETLPPLSAFLCAAGIECKDNYASPTK